MASRTLAYHKAESVMLAQVGKDERWLQERIEEDPSILGLGDLTIVQRERKQQASGGKIDFLMSDQETDTMFEVEVMLGRLDESHIIRTIEYWDLERRRYPSRNHVAVIVAEDITNRFFNVIGLLNRSVPIMAVKLNAFRVDEKLVLHFTRVLDLSEPPGEYEDDEVEQTDRAWWERSVDRESLGVVDMCVELLSADGRNARVTYNKQHIAMGGRRRNFAWFYPRRQRSHCLVEVKVQESSVESSLSQLEDAGLVISTTAAQGSGYIRVKLTARECREQAASVLRFLLTGADEIGGGL